MSRKGKGQDKGPADGVSAPAPTAVPPRVRAQMAVEPLARHAAIVSTFGSRAIGSAHNAPIGETISVLGEELAKAAKGDLSLASHLLTSHALSLDTIFAEMVRRSGNNLGEYPDAAERYMRLALKAQSNCRATLDALAKLHQPREQIVKHVHVNEGGQAVIADEFHSHRGGEENEIDERCQEPHCSSSQSATLLGQDPAGNGMPVPGGPRQETLQTPRWPKSGTA